MEYRILPKSVDETITTNEAGDALVEFADNMDGDMNCYFKSVPADTYVNEACKMIAAFIKSNNITPEDINEIYHAIATSDCVLGSKLWTDEDIKMALDDNFGGIGEILDENAQCEMANNIDEDAFDDCNDHEWEAIIDGIKDSGVFVKVKGIKWDVSEEDCDSEEERKKILNMLPKDVEIPIENFRNCDNYQDYISDYISDEYEWCHDGYESVEFTTEPTPNE